jgi:hypothetical protein
VHALETRRIRCRWSSHKIKSWWGRRILKMPMRRAQKSKLTQDQRIRSWSGQEKTGDAKGAWIHVEEMYMEQCSPSDSPSDPSPNIAQSGDQHKIMHHQVQYDRGIKPGTREVEDYVMMGRTEYQNCWDVLILGCNAEATCYMWWPSLIDPQKPAVLTPVLRAKPHANLLVWQFRPSPDCFARFGYTPEPEPVL